MPIPGYFIKQTKVGSFVSDFGFVSFSVQGFNHSNYSTVSCTKRCGNIADDDVTKDCSWFVFRINFPPTIFLWDLDNVDIVDNVDIACRTAFYLGARDEDILLTSFDRNSTTATIPFFIETTKFRRHLYIKSVDWVLVLLVNDCLGHGLPKLNRQQDNS